MNIGEKIKEIRIELGLTQEELADRTELSKGFISQIERNITSPSICTLEDILTCLGMNLSNFFSENEKAKIIFSDSDYFEKIDEKGGYKIRWIVPNAQKNVMEPILLSIKAGGKTIMDNPHEGEEFGYVIKGSIILHIGKETYKVKKGETFYMQPEKEHFIESDKGAEIIWVSSPPTF